MKQRRVSSIIQKMEQWKGRDEPFIWDRHSPASESSQREPVDISGALVQLKTRRGLEDGLAHPADISGALGTLRIQRTFQRKVDGAAEEIQSAAQIGVQTPSSSLPYLDQLQPLFGRHDLSHVQAHMGEEASASAHAMGARAYATGNHVVFAGSPDLHTAAHEAAHVVQQRGGVQLAGGVGQEGDEYERHADAVADRVAAGQSAEELLDRYTGGRAEVAAGGRTPQGEAPIQKKLTSWGFELETPWPTTNSNKDGSAATSGYTTTGWVAEDENAAAWTTQKQKKELKESKEKEKKNELEVKDAGKIYSRVEIVSKAFEVKEDKTADPSDILTEAINAVPGCLDYRIGLDSEGYEFLNPSGSPDTIPKQLFTQNYPGDYRLQVSVKYDEAMKLTDLAVIESNVEGVNEKLILELKTAIAELAAQYREVLVKSKLSNEPRPTVLDYLAWKTLARLLTTKQILADGSGEKESSHSKNVFGAMPRDFGAYKEGLDFAKEIKPSVQSGMATGLPKIDGKNIAPPQKVHINVGGYGSKEYQCIPPTVTRYLQILNKVDETEQFRQLIPTPVANASKAVEALIIVFSGTDEVKAIHHLTNIDHEEWTADVKALKPEDVQYETMAVIKDPGEVEEEKKKAEMINTLAGVMEPLASNAAAKLIEVTDLSKVSKNQRETGFHKVVYNGTIGVTKVVRDLVTELVDRRADSFEPQTGQHEHKEESSDNKTNLYELRYRPRTPTLAQPGNTLAKPVPVAATAKPGDAIEAASQVIARMVNEAMKISSP